ncbi:MAG: hypothetical protein R2838_25420 [Caldilineaceae bacterium]
MTGGLVDSVVINEYLEDVFPARPLRPADPYLAGRMRQWAKHADDYLQRSIAVFTHALTAKPCWRHMTAILARRWRPSPIQSS